ncbi:CRISPR-associated protein, Cas5e family [Aminomonas paucivorans DSM 12260]|uniref:CRISPR-associated protein, Cas5e family n=1 Tax=Aminomonas paucivorans DSM 12260 TaxID=584708 RepID=E3D0F8_9BACT|nr:type I-E CRISPR-associated protein Cas5/CasD [Aminomonas paucivorans]EFQ22977.1 CRISPR-associated protein, Cas5e family [Aminomonas paucivorans DSM 12260]
MPSLLLRLGAPMQSWGVHSAFGIRDTGREPSKSGVVGLLAAALGRDRHDPLDDLASLVLGVRVDREGSLMRDFQTAGGGQFCGSPYGVRKANGKAGDTVVSPRWYLADALFLVALGGEDPAFLKSLEEALLRPRYPLYLGRRSYPPTFPLVLGVVSEAAEEALRSYPVLPGSDGGGRMLRLVLESSPEEGGTPRMDVPLSFDPLERRYGVRYVRTELVEVVPSDRRREEMPCTSPG